MKRGELAGCDTSVVVPALISWHELHEQARACLEEQVTAIPAHVLVETYSVITRLPSPHRLSSGTAIDLLESLPHTVLVLRGESYLRCLRRMSSFGISGGASYDGLIAATAAEHGLPLFTLDARATSTYDALGARWSTPA